ncbi:Flp family type IVb pilin [Mesorhizobium sp. RP14(2022)]|jgi:pilus assembly protein Flp/PilA|uniref:Flp family type IVb pilin n=1 Tax=Mesorhizobium liriopis TaxID=2953882 RepID=A0ABT1CA57_9HYPH|nr:Flp family type IVb pilin [Mesorhizobium liriopis]MCO6051707.1 Flp family type IVb pilin [Mesorhizobium liriopis]
MQLLKRFARDEKGATIVEYGIILTVLSLVIIGGVGQASDAIQQLFEDNNSHINQALSQ